jgi:uncharacterized protein (DUF1800 family)
MISTRRQFIRVSGAGGLLGATLLLGCERQFDDLAVSLEGERDFDPPVSDDIDDVTHVLNRLTFGPRPGEYQRVKSIGLTAFIDEQLEPGAIPDRRCEWRVNQIESVNAERADLFEHDPRHLLFDLTRVKVLRAVYSRRQLFEVMVDFWTDHFNVSWAKDQCRWLKIADDREVIRSHALGRFSDLLRASMLSPAMLIYLDGHDNRVKRPGDRPNENYARELLELHALGVDGGYTQQDVMEIARCLSGWTYGHSFLRPDRVRFDPANHDDGAKRVLGRDIPAGEGERDLDHVIDIVSSHPSTARYIARRLCRRFIADQPADSAVEQVSRAYIDSDGDIRATLRAVFQCEAFSQSKGGLFKRPFRFVVSALRASDARTTAGEPLLRSLERMGHSPFQYPTPDGYPMEPGPWLGTMLWRWNFARALASGEIGGTSIDAAGLTDALGGTGGLASQFLGRVPSEIERDVLASSAQPLAVLMASPAFQRH